jgi:cytochrome c oxidase subunit 2
MKGYFNQRVVLIILGAFLGVGLAVWLVEYGMDDTHSFTTFDPTVEIIMSDVFQSPPPVTEHGWNVDRVIVFVHVMMGVLFVGWTLYFLACLVKFRESVHPKAESTGPSKFWTNIVEYGVILAEVVLIVSFAVPLWGEVMNEQKIAQIKKDADSGKGLEIHILAKQFDWNARYAGNDNQFAAQSIAYANKTDNPFGIDNRDGAIDDVIILNAREKNRAIMVPADTPIALKITSMDVIHSFKVLPLRVCKDAIPGLQLPIHFETKTDYLKISKLHGLTGVGIIECKKELEKTRGDLEAAIKSLRDQGATTVEGVTAPGEYIYAIQCAQLCGSGHASMIGYLKVVPKDDFKKWLADESAKQQKARGGAQKTVAQATQ